MPLLFLLFILVPIVEIAVLIKVGGIIGLLPTLAIVVLTAFLGTRMLKSQGRATLDRARQRLDGGEMPAGEIVEGMLLLVGGVMLLTPGFVTDAFGFACLIPPSRRWLASRLSARSLGVVVGGGFRPGGFGRTGFPGGRVGSGGGVPPGAVPPRPGASDVGGAGGRGPDGSRAEPRGDVIEGDYRRLDD